MFLSHWPQNRNQYPQKKGNFPHTSTLCTRLLYFRLNHYSSFFQVGVGFNRDKWENLERYARSCTKIYKNVYVCTGPLYLPSKDFNDGKNYVKYQVIGKNNVAVPTHFFKVIVGELDNNDGQQLEMEAYVLPNAQIPDNVALATFQVIISSKLYMLSVFVLKTRLKIVSVLTWESQNRLMKKVLKLYISLLGASWRSRESSRTAFFRQGIKEQIGQNQWKEYLKINLMNWM